MPWKETRPMDGKPVFVAEYPMRSSPCTGHVLTGVRASCGQF